jgi:hypothetical protein
MRGPSIGQTSGDAIARTAMGYPRRLDFPTRHTAHFDDLDRRAPSFVFLFDFPRNTQTAS